MRKANEEFKEHKKRKHAEMVALQSLPFPIKLKKAMARIDEFIAECDGRGLNYHISVGGLDSIALLLLIRHMGYGADRVPAISVSGIEDVSIIKIHKKLGVIPIKPMRGKAQVIKEFGFPVISKKITNKIDTLQNPSEKNATTRHAIITGECGKQGHFSKDSRMQLPKKWLYLFGGWDEEGAALGYKKPPFLCSDKCCYWLKELPCDIWAKEHNSVPFLGLMASEGGRRQEALEEHGCNYFGATVIRSCPFSPWFQDDVIRLLKYLDAMEYIPEIYGNVVKNYDGKYMTTGARRTGCNICGFGIHMEKRPHRFDRLWERNPKQWERTMYSLYTEEDGTPRGWGEVLDYIGVEWREPWNNLADQMSFLDYPEIFPEDEIYKPSAEYNRNGTKKKNH